MILSIILGVLDILGGILLIAGGFASYHESGFILTMGGVFITKGLMLFLYGRFGGKPHYNWLAVIDMLTGIIMVSMYFNIYFSVFGIIGMVMVLKGIIGFVKGLV